MGLEIDYLLGKAHIIVYISAPCLVDPGGYLFR